VHDKIEEKIILAPFGIDWGVWGLVVMPFLLSRVSCLDFREFAKKTPDF